MVPVSAHAAQGLLFLDAVRILQARFHFYPGDPDPLIVAAVVWHMAPHGARPVVHPLFGPRGTQSPVQILSELRHLVADASQEGRRDPYHALLSLRGGCWSFVNVSDRETVPWDRLNSDSSRSGDVRRDSSYEGMSPHETLNRQGGRAAPGASGADEAQVIVVH